MTALPNASLSQTEEIVLQAPIQKISGNPFSWFMRKGYPQGAFWAVMITLVSVTNDILMRLLGAGLDIIQISFFRFFFGMLAVVPLMLSHGTTLFKTSRPWMHFWRAILGVCAIGGACYSVNLMPLSDNTIIMSSQPFFFLPMAVLFLHEKVDLSRWIAILIGFIGLLIMFQPGAEALRIVALVPIAAAIFFAMSDVVAKKMVTTENTHTMLFYFAVGTTIITLIPAMLVWQTPSWYQLGMLALLGIGGNLIQVCMIRAFSATEASALSPFRYVEFIFAALFGFVFFLEIPTLVTLAGASFIIAGTAYISYYETRKEAKKNS
ncbi:MAG: DMT family transporter [Alphaproteobacteria bacterium]|jgi:S-adenosylmethionine uptake transporter|nr:DMT family transporter [Alphaproteobacteria bacterium]